VADRIVCSARPRSSKAWKNRVTPAGAVKWALPSGCTGVVPTTNLPGSSAVTPMWGVFIHGCDLGGTPTTRRAFTEPRSTPVSPW